jgi:predicted Rossmann fold nucleotide-binding protein DprA/Smf involved in DNA uptake
VVSGLAQGIDQAGMIAAAKAGGRTIGVLGSGLARVHPPSAERSLDLLLERGALVSEYPLTAEPLRQHFPQRNSIIAGLALGTCVVEAAKRSGSLITARQALDANREVFAFPGDITRNNNRGTNDYIRRGEARLVMSAQDILQDLEPRLRQFLAEETFRQSASGPASWPLMNLSEPDETSKEAPKEAPKVADPPPKPRKFVKPETFLPVPREGPKLPPPPPKPAPKPLEPVSQAPKPKPEPVAAAPLPAEDLNDNGPRGLILRALQGASAVHWDELLRQAAEAKISDSDLSMAMLELEMEGFVKQHPGKLYKRL